MYPYDKETSLSGHWFLIPMARGVDELLFMQYSIFKNNQYLSHIYLTIISEKIICIIEFFHIKRSSANFWRYPL